MVWSVPFFMGERTSELEFPFPHGVIDPLLPAGSPQARMGALYRHLAEELTAHQHDAPPVVVAGDCVASVGVLAFLQQAGVAPMLVWFDAHGDFHTWETTQSRFIGGMPLAMLTGRGEQTVMEAAGTVPIADSQVVLVGARDLDPGEDQALWDSGVTQAEVADVAGLVSNGPPLYVHIDADVVDPTEMPAMNYPAPNGPSLEDVQQAVQTLSNTGRLAALSVSSWNPDLPDAHRAAAAVASLLEAASV